MGQIKKLAAYNVEDSNLVIDLYDHLNFTIGAIQLSNVVGTSIVDAYTRGQQMRCKSKVYRSAYQAGRVMDYRITERLDFEGGLVQTPIVGIHDYVMCDDFKSMYPSVII